MEGGYPGMEGSGSGYGYGMEGSGYGMEGSGYDTEDSGYGMEGSGYGYGMDGSGYPGMGGMGMPTRGPKAEYLLVRFFDLRVMPGRKYRYRIQVLVEDPNHPRDPRYDPKERTLDDAVKVRLKEVEAEEAKADNQRIYYRRSEWSAPSGIVTVEAPSMTFAGEVQLPTTARTIEGSPGDRYTSAQTEPSGKVIAVAWNSRLAVDVPGVMDVLRGTVLNFTTDASIVHPVTKVYKELKDFAFNTNCVVLDFRGGENLPVTPSGDGKEDEEPLKAPGEFVFVDDSGQIFVRNELDDLDAFKRYSPPEEKKAPSGMPGYPGMEEGYGEEGMYPGMEGGSGYPGYPGTMEDGGGRRGRR
jgi:hypothetical protein